MSAIESVPDRPAIESMTGFAEARAESPDAHQPGLVLICRAKSLNHRFLDVKVRLPRGDPHAFEFLLRKAVSGRFKRGAIEVSIAVEAAPTPASGQHAAAGQPGAYVNREAALLYWKAFQDVYEILKLESSPGLEPVAPTMDAVLRAPGVLAEGPAGAVPAGLWGVETVARVAGQALDALKTERLREGAALKNHLARLLDEIEARLGRIEALEPDEKTRARESLAERAKSALQLLQECWQGSTTGQAPGPEFESRIREEAALWLERRDFEEERVRLRAHLARFRALLESPAEAAGRQLEFLHQEMLREVNTLGNKAQSAAISTEVVDAKSLLDRLREQLANVE